MAAFAFFIMPWLLIALALVAAWWVIGSLLSVSLGTVVVWVLFFAAGYALGSQQGS
jgi:hypothetical protein